MEEKKGLLARLQQSRPVQWVSKSIRNKLLVALLALSVPALVVLGIVTYATASNALTQEVYNKLQAVETIKANSVASYYDEKRRDLDNLAEQARVAQSDTISRLGALTQAKRARLLDTFRTWEADVVDVSSDLDIVSATTALSNSFRSTGATRARGLYLGKPALQDAADGSDYSKVHANQQSFFTGYIKIHGYPDAFIIDPAGNIVYSTQKDDSFATNLMTGAFKDSGLAALYKQLQAAPDGKAYVADLAMHGKDWAMFIGSPIYDGTRQVGILAYRLPLTAINNIVQDRVGFSQTGETYLAGKVGDNILYRSDRVVKTGNIGGQRTATTYVVDALAGKPVTDFEVGSTGAYEVATAYPLQFLNLNWAIVSTVSVADAMVTTPAGQQKDYYQLIAERLKVNGIYLLSPDGFVFYSTGKLPDFQTNMLTGPYKESNFGLMVDDVVKTKASQTSHTRPYAPNNDEPSIFIATPMLDATRNIDMIVAFALSLQDFSALMQESTGLGTTGESYIVGSDKTMRTDSRFLKDLNVKTTVFNQATKVDTQAVTDGFAGKHGIAAMNNYRGIPVLSAWTPYKLSDPSPNIPQGNTWVIIAEANQSEVLAPVQTMALVTAGLVLFTTVLVVLAALWLANALVNQVRAIMDLFNKIGMGEFGARTKVMSGDELGTMALSLNSMLDNTLTLIQSREERDSIQTAVVRLLEEVADVAKGDLTRQAQVTADMTGAVADAFNFMIDQLRRIISRVQDTTLQVSSSASEIQTTAEHLAQGSETQAQQIVDTSAALEEMAVSIQQVSDNAALSATVAEQAMANAKQGTQAVQNTILAMNRIRDQSQETSKRIKRLGESSQEISEIVRLIDDIADRTSILALNASIQAAMAGEAGRGFAIVAEEVERLAERSTAATRQIETLVKTIQGETNETVAAMEDNTREVVEGSQLANQAGGALGEIESVSNRLAELIQSISLASKQQARGAETLSQSMTEISDVTQQTAAGTKQAAASINNLAVLAEELRASVSTFKLSGA